MKVLWIVNSPFPDVTEELKLKDTAKGWIFSSANSLLKQNKEIKLAVVSFYQGKDLKELTLNEITHYLLPEKIRYFSNNYGIRYWQYIKSVFIPDVIHIHGSEYFHSYSFVRACGPEKVVLSIQGLVSVYERYYYGGIPVSDLIKYTTPRDLVRFDTFFSKRKNMRKRGFFEKLLIESLSHIIGRTSWDHDHVWALNPNATYHFCNETLRSSFYKNKWSVQNCTKYSIFVSQAQYPIKGFHQLVKALAIVVRHFPETKVYVAGTNYFSNRGIRLNGYGNLINSLINKYNLAGHIEFTGFLSEEKMVRRFLDSHISVCPSAIENSPNSVGEAQILGVPCLASISGGTADMIEHGKTGLLHRFEEVEMLASNICKIFSDDNFALEISENSRKIAANRHGREQNAKELYQIYKKIMTYGKD
jgi:glycosyltransferase involved in cell wall biosynthesis